MKILLLIVVFTLILMFINIVYQTRYTWSGLTLGDKPSLKVTLKLVKFVFIDINPYKLRKYYKTILLYEYHLNILFEYMMYFNLNNLKNLSDSDKVKLKKLIYKEIEGKDLI